MNELEEYRRAALKEIKSNLPRIKKIAQSALDGVATVRKVKPIGSVTNPSKFNENSDVDIGIYVTTENLPAGMNEDLSWRTQEAFIGNYFDVSGVLNTVVYVMDNKMNEDAAQPITPAQLDALERVVDKVFANLNIDVEFTKHFIDRVNDERNKRQITIRELGELFAKEYRRWGNTIKHMPVDAQAVMKDLSSAINIPFVLNKDEKGKELVAKTVMRKKDFKTPNKELPVESVTEAKGKLSDVIPQLQKELNQGAGFDRNVFELEMGQRTRAPGTWGFGSAGGGIMIRWMTHGAKSLAEERGVDVQEVVREARQYIKRWLQENTKPMKVRDRDSGETKVFYIRGPLAFDDNNHYVRVNTKRMLQNPSRFEIKEGEKHGAKTGSQVKGSEPVPAKRKPTKGGETPHPMRGRLVGEGFGDPGSMTGLPGRVKWRSSTKPQSPEEWKAGNEKAYNDMVAYQRDLYNKYLKSGRKASSREKQTWRQLGFMESEMDQPPLDVPTPTPAEIAQKHGVDLAMIEDQLQKGIKVEMEHTEDPFAAMEIALDHLNEMPDYYDELATIEPHHYTDESVMASWESYRDLDEKLVDPREAILQKALKYLDKKVQMYGSRQSLGGYAFDVANEVNLRGIATARELAQMYRDWKGDSVVTEGWMESNLYYLDEVIREDDDPCWDGYRQLGTKKKKGREVPNCVPKKKK